ncbi:molecular chaperone HtpG [Nematocida sp. AWRm80]|nr:molecular chaperone HtpG [Nematocida sp. AWRm80]
MTDHIEVENNINKPEIDNEIEKYMAEVKNDQPREFTNEKPDVSVEGAEEHTFDAQIDSLLSILISSVYSSKDYFLRELISNASDAIDKRKRMTHATGKAIEEEMSIKIVSKKEEGKIIISDTGIGMTKADMINFLGSIATSGTKEFKKKLAENQQKDIGALIGQFGLGFYSAFLVADQVDVISKGEGDVAHIWSSKGPGGFVIAPYTEEFLQQGTSIILHISPKSQEYLDEKKLENIIKVHSGFIEYPIYLLSMVEKTRKVPKKQEEKEEKTETETDAVEEIKEEEQEEEETYYEQEYKHLNKMKALWLRDPKETPISKEEYAEFYKTLTNDWEDHRIVCHSSVDGDAGFGFQVLLFIQKREPFAMFEQKSSASKNIKLYVQNVLITSDLTEAVPEWMNFVHGIISSKDIPMNVSREIVQGKSVLNLIKKVLMKKVFDMLKELKKDEKEYAEFYKTFSSSLKLGIYLKDSDNTQQKLATFLKFPTNKSEGKEISLDEYISRMLPDQKQIYILTGVNLKEIEASPFLEKMKECEVLLLANPIDEFVVQSLMKYKDIPFQRINGEGLELPPSISRRDIKEFEESYKPFLEKIKALLQPGVDSVILSPDLSTKPCSVSSAKYAQSAAMEHIARAQPERPGSSILSQGGFLNKKIFELNPTHPIVTGLFQMFTTKGEDSEEFKNAVSLAYETALLLCGYPIDNTIGLADKIMNYLQTGLERTSTTETN